jgi:pSer/pThr/pTyr-binding forkhead associated (FHA) protein
VIKLILEERGELKETELERDALTIGRTADNAIRVQDALSSRRHCKIEKTPEGWFVEDLKSRNGTTLNGQRLEGRRVLAVGDRIAIGDSVVHFGARIAAATPPAAKPSGATPRPSGGPVKSQKIVKDATGAPRAAAQKKPRYVLKCTEGAKVGKAFAIPALPFTIGRKKGVGLLIEEEDVSAEHCMLVEDEGSLHVVDLNSQAGTFVQGKKVKGRERLGPNDTLAIGKTKFRFKDHAAKDAEPISDDDIEPLGGKPISDRVAIVPTAPPVQEVTDLDSLGEDEEDDPARTPAAGVPKVQPKSQPPTAPPPKTKTGRNVNPVAPAAAVALEADPTGISLTDFPSVSLEPQSEGGAGGIVAVIVAVVVLLVSALPVLHSFLGREAIDPAPEGSYVRNWSFEDPRDPLRGWKVDGPPGLIKVVTEGVLHGTHAVRVESTPRESRARLEVAEPHRVVPGQLLALHAAIKTSGQAAAVLGVEWLDETDPDWKDLATAAIVEGSSEWEDAGDELVVPARATHGRVVAFAIPLSNGSGSAWFDQISLLEEEGTEKQPRLQGAGLIVSASKRGVLEIRRPAQNGAPELLLARAHLEIAAPDGSRGDPLSTQLSWQTTTPAGDPGDGGLFADGTILDAALGSRVQSAVAVKPVADVLKVWWETGKKDLAEGRAVRIVIVAPRLRDISPVELQTQSGATATLEQAFAKYHTTSMRIDDILEIAWGSGADQASLKPQKAALEVEKVGDGVRFELVCVPELRSGEVRVAGFDIAKASSLAHGRIRELLNAAEQSRKDGRLEDARQAYLRLAAEFAHDAPVASRARREADALALQADRLLESVTGAAEDAADLGVPELARAAHQWIDALAKAFPGATQLAKAAAAVARADERLAKAGAVAKTGRARELVLLGARHREGNRNRLARTIYEYVVAHFPPEDPSVKDAQERLAAMPAEKED